MANYKYIIVEDLDLVRTVTLNRASVHNAFNDGFIKELTHVANETNEIEKLRLFVLKSTGKSFCAGADLEWMKRMKSYSYEENLNDSLNLANMFKSINDIKVPVLAIVHGYTLGGGTGILASCDYVLADDNSQFGFTEVKLGLIPAVISPYLIRKIGESQARAYFMSGVRFGVKEACHMNLIHESCHKEKLEQRSKELIQSFLQTGPKASVASKKLLFSMCEQLRKSSSELNQITSEVIAKLRTTDEAQRGMSALLNKEKINWVLNE